MAISKPIIFEESRRGGGGGKNFRGSKLFQGDGSKLHFSIETYRTRYSPAGGGGVQTPCPPLDSCIAYVHVSMFVAF